MVLLFVVLALLSVGLVMVFSATPSVAMRFGDVYYHVKRQVFFLLLSFLAMYLAYHINLETLKKWTPAIFLFSFGALLLVLLPGIGKKVSGATRWIDLFIFSFQPSEFAKLGLVLFLSLTLSNLKERVANFRQGVLPVMLISLMVLAVVMLEPDLGTALIIAAMVFMLLFVAGASLWQLGGLFLLGASGVAVLSVTSAYRLRRLVGYLDPWKDPLNVGFQVIQSLLAVGSGGLLGLGIGCSKQKFYYLPQQYTDFIFAVLCEETGLLGAVFVLTLFFVFAARGLRLARRVSDRYQSLLVCGIVAWITCQTLVNVFVVLGLLPATGIPLPFVSYGGSSLLFSMFAVGLILNISANLNQEAKRRA